VIDKLPAACKYINEVMTNESDVTEILHMLKQGVCAKG
jgi:tRNA-splicing ligase RtcB (3'-phosphate/5'-hydroxy nucleic acid ligase)